MNSARKKVEGSIKEYATEVKRKADLSWVVGEVNFAMKELHVPLDEIRAIVSKVESRTTEEGRKRLSDLRARINI
jgi:hypothetical protein